MLGMKEAASLRVPVSVWVVPSAVALRAFILNRLANGVHCWQYEGLLSAQPGRSDPTQANVCYQCGKQSTGPRRL